MTRYLLLVLIAAGLTACGFHLRGGESLPLAMRKVFVTGLPTNDPLQAALVSALGRAGAAVVPSAGDDAVVLKVGAGETIRSISLNRTGITREYDLGYNVSYEIKNAKGETIEPLQKLKLNREQYNDQFLIMGRSEETAQIRLEMQEEAAETLVRRMAFLLRDKSAGSGFEQPQAGPARGESQGRDEYKAGQ